MEILIFVYMGLTIVLFVVMLISDILEFNKKAETDNRIQGD